MNSEPAYFDSILASTYELLISGASDKELIRIARQYWNNPVYIGNPVLDPIAFSNDFDIEDSAWHVLTQGDEKARLQLEQTLNTEGIIAESLSSSKPMIIRSCFLDHRVLYNNIIWKKHVIGMIMIFEYYRPFQASDSAYLEAFSRILAYQIVSSTGNGFSKNPYSEEILLLLLEGNYKENQHSKFLTFVPKDDYQYVIAAIPLIRSALFSYSHQLKILRSDFHDSISGIFNEHVVLLFQIRQGSAAEARLENQLSSVSEYRKTQIGLSNYYSKITDTAAAFKEASVSARIGKTLLLEKRLLRYKDVSLFHMFELISETTPLTVFMDKNIYNLIEHDKTYQTDRFSTFVAYIACDCNLDRAAAVLNVHRGTVYYRICQIQDIFGFTINNPSFHFKARLTINLLYYQNPEHFCKRLCFSADKIHLPLM